MIRWLTIASLIALGCAGEPRPAPSLPLTAALVQLSQQLQPSADDDAFVRGELARIAARVRQARLQSSQRPTHEVLSHVVFEELGFVREVDDPSLRYVLLPTVLRARKGSCVGLGTLYLALAEHLGLDMKGVLVPSHFFVQLRDGSTTYPLELLRRGEAMPERWHRERWPIAGGTGPAYLRPLQLDEVLAVVLFDIGNDRRAKQQLIDAERAYTSAAKRFPDFAEAHASAGAVAHLLGSIERAEAAYRAALAANPNLPGVARNLELLAAERRAAGSGPDPALRPGD